MHSSCKEIEQTTAGCSHVSGYLPLATVKVDIDSDREIEKIHALLLNSMDKLEAMQGQSEFNIHLLSMAFNANKGIK